MLLLLPLLPPTTESQEPDFDVTTVVPQTWPPLLLPSWANGSSGQSLFLHISHFCNLSLVQNDSDLCGLGHMTASKLQKRRGICNYQEAGLVQKIPPNREKMTDKHKYDRCHYTFQCASSIQHCNAVYLRMQELQRVYDFLTHFDLTCLEALKEDLKLYSQVVYPGVIHPELLHQHTQHFSTVLGGRY